MNSEFYQQIPQENVRISICELKLRRKWSCCKCKTIIQNTQVIWPKKWLKQQKVNVLKWPSTVCKGEWAKTPPSQYAFTVRLINYYQKFLFEFELLLIQEAHQLLKAKVQILLSHDLKLWIFFLSKWTNNGIVLIKHHKRWQRMMPVKTATLPYIP